MTPPFKVGDRIELVRMGDDPCPIEPGTTGTVDHVTYIGFEPKGWQVGVKWDNGRGLQLLVPPDVAKRI